MVIGQRLDGGPYGVSACFDEGFHGGNAKPRLARGVTLARRGSRRMRDAQETLNGVGAAEFTE
jgi:hypothetical protein